ncbi:MULTISPECIES: hypothetical protein [unclassified Rhizobium]|uniref:hypothetical protein n=1 Tax=Rhizobium TaxID=379 RepID=UPI00084BDB2B|nr:MULTISPECIES: hypothetical protein [unclassified Rhizobium]OEC95670.1 hypothetical protein A9Z06_31455 [Rhizobium sp. YK2]QYA15287.1 hypothetical protein J5284_19940 [Rhizobium sp. AB2/73]UEQ83846.1 hypothetical protein I8E17_21070 [Rhizobium sp. AB2/73]
MSTDCTRTEEALLAGAGYPLPHHQDCDFRLDRTDSDEWEITVVSSRAQAWVHEEFCNPLAQCLSDRFKVDVLSADQFLKQVHVLGFRTEFIGAGGRDLF